MFLNRVIPWLISRVVQFTRRLSDSILVKAIIRFSDTLLTHISDMGFSRLLKMLPVNKVIAQLRDIFVILVKISDQVFVLFTQISEILLSLLRVRVGVPARPI